MYNSESKTIEMPKPIAIIKFCGGAVTLTITDNCDFVPPTEAQRKNLKEMFCIDVELLEENK